MHCLYICMVYFDSLQRQLLLTYASAQRSVSEWCGNPPFLPQFHTSPQRKRKVEPNLPWIYERFFCEENVLMFCSFPFSPYCFVILVFQYMKLLYMFMSICKSAIISWCISIISCILGQESETELEDVIFSKPVLFWVVLTLFFGQALGNPSPGSSAVELQAAGIGWFEKKNRCRGVSLLSCMKCILECSNMCFFCALFHISYYHIIHEFTSKSYRCYSSFILVVFNACVQRIKASMTWWHGGLGRMGDTATTNYESQKDEMLQKVSVERQWTHTESAISETPGGLVCFRWTNDNRNPMDK